MKIKTVLLLVAAVAATLQSAPAQVVANGGFESPDITGQTVILKDQTGLSSWVIGGSGVKVLDDSSGPLSGPAYEGNQYVDLDSTSGPGEITQTFATVPGKVYEFSFAYTNNYLTANGNVGSKAVVRIFDADNQRYAFGFNPFQAKLGDLKWTPFKQSFTAVQTTTSIQFISFSDDGSTGGVLIDAVSVQEAPPPPALKATFLAGIKFNAGALYKLNSKVSVTNTSESKVKKIGVTFYVSGDKEFDAGDIAVDALDLKTLGYSKLKAGAATPAIPFKIKFKIGPNVDGKYLLMVLSAAGQPEQVVYARRLSSDPFES